MAASEDRAPLAGIPNDSMIGMDTETPSLRVALTDGEGNPIDSLNGAIDFHDADSHTRPLNLPVVRSTATTTNPDANIASGDYSFDVSGGAGVNFPAGSEISIAEGSLKETVIFTVTIQSTDTLTLDMPVGLSYTTTAVITLVSTNIASISGSLASPQVYEIAPPAGEVWHLYRFIVNMTHNANGADNLFGDQAALTNGVVFRIVNGGIFNFTNWKTNSDMAGDFFDLVYAPKQGSSDFGTRGRGSIKISSGAVARLDGDLGQSAQILVQDDPTGLNTFGVKFQGHIEGQ